MELEKAPCEARFSATAVWQKWRFSSPQTHLWLIKVWFSASTFVVKIATFAKPQNVSFNCQTIRQMKYLRIIILYPLLTFYSYGQKDTLIQQYFISGHISFGAAGTDINGYSFSGSFLSKHIFVSTEFDHFLKYQLKDLTKKDLVSGINIVSGLHFSKKHFLLSAGTGISYLFGEKYFLNDLGGFSGPDKFRDFGLPITIDVLAKPFKWLGIGAELKWNINNSVPYNNLMLKLTIGKLR